MSNLNEKQFPIHTEGVEKQTRENHDPDMDDFFHLDPERKEKLHDDLNKVDKTYADNGAVIRQEYRRQVRQQNPSPAQIARQPKPVDPAVKALRTAKKFSALAKKSKGRRR
jgi:hypothetical protein